MPAAIGDKFNKVINGTTRPVATTLSAQKLVGAVSATVTATTGWDTATAVHGIMYRTDSSGDKVAGSQIDWKGVISGTTINNFTVTAGTDDTYAIGTTVELAPTAAWGDDMATGLVVEHNQDGTHAAVTATSVTATGTVQGATVVATGDIQHRSVSLETIRSNSMFDFVASGLVWSGDSYGVNRNASMTAGVIYIGGKRVAVSAVTARTFTASRDTYVDIDNAGTITYTEVVNNAASPALAANNIRVAIIVTAAGSIAAVGSVNQGQENKVLPIASSIPYAVTDSLGNLICPRDPNRKVLGYRQIVANFTTTAVSTDTAVTGLSVPFIAPADRKIRVRSYVQQYYSSGAAGFNMAHTVKESTTQLAYSGFTNPAANYAEQACPEGILTPTAGLHTYVTNVNQGTAGTLTFPASATAPAWIVVELA